MKRTLLLVLMIPGALLAQTKTTVGSGDFYNPLTWDCTCLPANGDSLIINHAITMSVNIYYTAGRITINPGGSLIEDATDRAYWADGTGSLVNHGTFTTHLLLLSTDAALTNTGTMASIDSIWNQGYVMSSGDISSLDVLNDETGTFHNHGTFNIANNFNNQGFFHMLSGATLEVGNDFSNCNIQTMDAWFENHGVVCIGNNFSNCGGDTLAGNGHYFVGGSSANLGVFTDSLTFHTPSGTLGVTGTIGPNVTITTGACNIGVKEEVKEPFRVYPNPTTDNISLTVNNVAYELYDCTGKLIKKGVVENNSIDMDELRKGLYLLKVDGHGTTRIIKK